LEEREPIIGTIPKNSLISVESLALYLGCSVEGLKNWLRKYESLGVRYTSVNGKWLIDVDSLMGARKQK